jgi:hypothetical protein
VTPELTVIAPGISGASRKASRKYQVGASSFVRANNTRLLKSREGQGPLQYSIAVVETIASQTHARENLKPLTPRIYKHPDPNLVHQSTTFQVPTSSPPARQSYARRSSLRVHRHFALESLKISNFPTPRKHPEASFVPKASTFHVSGSSPPTRQTHA